MKSDRKSNIIKALKNEILGHRRYEELLKPTTPIKLDRTELTHLRLKSSFSAYEVSQMPKDVIPDLLIRKMCRAFTEDFSKLPIVTEVDERENEYTATLDLWVKPIPRYMGGDSSADSD